jgi:hypothetical protein
MVREGAPSTPFLWINKGVDGRPSPIGVNVATLAAPESSHPVMAGLVPAIHDLGDINR